MADTLLSPTASATEQSLVLGVWRLLGSEPIHDTASNDPGTSGTSLTIATGGADRYEIGDRIEWPFDGTYERAEVTGVADTTLTIRRGIDGSTAAAHAANAVFVKGSEFWGINIQKAVNDSVAQDLYPDLFAVYEAQFSPSTTWAAETTLINEIAVEAEDIIRAYQKSDSTPTVLREVGLTRESPFYADTGLAATEKKAIEFNRIPDTDNTIFVQYLRSPAIGDLSDGMQRVVEYGAARRVLEWKGAYHLTRPDIEQSGTIAPGAAQREARWFGFMQEEARRSEKAILNRRFPRRQPRWRPGVRRRHYTTSPLR